jgi:starch synthase
MFQSLAERYPDKFAVKIAYDNALAHKIEAGSDMFLMPSHYEPCGLNQIYSLRYGTPPVVRATGGLDDTVDNWDPDTKRGNGFKFWDYNGYSLLQTVRWALRTYQYPDAWRALMRNGMECDYSWARSAEQYETVYHHVREQRRFWIGR